MKNSYEYDVFSQMEKSLKDPKFMGQFKEPVIKKEASRITPEQKLVKEAIEFLNSASEKLDFLHLDKSAGKALETAFIVKAEFNKEAIPSFEIEIPNQNEIDVVESDPELEVLDEIFELNEDDGEIDSFEKYVKDLEFENELKSLEKDIDQESEDLAAADDRKKKNKENYDWLSDPKWFEDEDEDDPFDDIDVQLGLKPGKDLDFADDFEDTISDYNPTRKPYDAENPTWFEDEDDDFFSDIDKQLGLNHDLDEETREIVNLDRQLDHEFARSDRLVNEFNRRDYKENPRDAGTVVGRKVKL